MKIIFFILIFSLNSIALPTWTLSDSVPVDGQKNILQLPPNEFAQAVQDGKIDAQVYPVEITGLLLPLNAIRKTLNDQSGWDEGFVRIVQWFSPIKSFDSFLDRLGLHPYPRASDSGVYQVPRPSSMPIENRMGLSQIQRDGTTGFTFSCAACHSSRLFGRTVLGLTNRFPRANHYFSLAKQTQKLYNPIIFAATTGATPSETQMMTDSIQLLSRIETKEPLVLGLDTSLAQVSLSLNRRAEDEYATPDPWSEVHPREDLLDHQPADSKPAVWWNLKYKNRWLSDGSVISGNPIFTNILWNEIGRGTDLQDLEIWLKANAKTVENLAAAVFSTEAPRFTDFFPAEKIELERAQEGEKIFLAKCVRCHGFYEKAWSHPEKLNKATPSDWLKTLHVRPLVHTIVKDVGTDPLRAQGMKSLEKLNDLSISKANNIVIQAQKGYVPPPLVGIWARWPYMHNNSIPNLCELLTPAADRAKSYFAGEAVDPKVDFDLECNGYPLGAKTPRAWKSKSYFYNTKVKGLSNSGHDEDIFVENGVNTLSLEDRKNLIQYLQTL